MADNVSITAGSGTVIGTETATVNSVAVQLQEVKPVLGARDAYTGSQGGRVVDGSTDTAAAFNDPRPNVADVNKNPTISTSAYASGNSLGGVIDFGAIARASGSPLYIVSATLSDSSQQNAAIDLFLFNANPSNGTYTDHATPTYNKTDALMVRGVIPFSAYANIGTGGSVCSVPNIGLSIVPNATQHLYGLMLVRGTPTYAALAITVELEYIAD